MKETEEETHYHSLLWQQLHKCVANGNKSMFVLSEGELLDYADYEPSNQMSGYNILNRLKVQ